jgi:hypothetical protein
MPAAPLCLSFFWLLPLITCLATSVRSPLRPSSVFRAYSPSVFRAYKLDASRDQIFRYCSTASLLIRCRPSGCSPGSVAVISCLTAVCSTVALSAFASGYGSILCVGFLSVPYAVSFALEATIWLAQHPTATSATWRLSVSLFGRAVCPAISPNVRVVHVNRFTVRFRAYHPAAHIRLFRFPRSITVLLRLRGYDSTGTH